MILNRAVQNENDVGQKYTDDRCMNLSASFPATSGRTLTCMLEDHCFLDNSHTSTIPMGFGISKFPETSCPCPQDLSSSGQPPNIDIKGMDFVVTDPFPFRMQRFLKFESMKARSFVEEALDPSVAVQPSGTAFDCTDSKSHPVCSLMVQRSTADQICLPFLSDCQRRMHSSCHARPGPIKHNAESFICRNESVLGVAAIRTTASPFEPIMNKMGDDMIDEVKQKRTAVLACAERLNSQSGAVKSRISTLHLVERLTNSHMSASPPNMFMQDQDSTSSKRLIRTDSHEKLATVYSERANTDNVLYCKGRRWGGERVDHDLMRK